jgi:hypothetical protein
MSDFETFLRILVRKDWNLKPLFELQSSASMIPVRQHNHFRGGDHGQFLDRPRAQFDWIDKTILPVNYVRTGSQIHPATNVVGLPEQQGWTHPNKVIRNCHQSELYFTLHP